MGHIWDIDGTLMKPPTVSSDMCLPGGSVTELLLLGVVLAVICNYILVSFNI